MTNEIKLRQTGGSVSATLPKALVESFQLEPGDRVFAIETEQGILLTPYDPHFEAVMKAYQRGSRKYRQALRELAR